MMVSISGLGKTEQGLKTALSVEKTSLRGGKIVNKGNLHIVSFC